MSLHHQPGARLLTTATAFAGLALAGLVGAATPAAADQPEIQKTPAGQTITLSQDSCTFPVREVVRAGQFMTKVLVDADGVPRVLMGSGALTGTLTHVLPDGNDGPSLRINFSGPGKVDPATGVVSAAGPWLVEGPDDPNTVAFEGFMLLVRGQSTIGPDPITGGPVISGARGDVVDLCAALR